MKPADITKLVLQIFEVKYADFPFRYIYVDQKLTESYLNLIRKFTKFNEDLRWDNNFELSQITNIDETPLFMNIPNTKKLLKFV